MTIDNLTIGDARAIAALMSGGDKRPSAATIDHGLAIAVLDRGFVYVGNVTTDADWCLIADAKNVRRWGTKAGLGELAAKGPQPNTVLDSSGAVRAPMRALIAVIRCEAASWKR